MATRKIGSKDKASAAEGHAGVGADDQISGLDETNKNIIAQLQEDGRRSYVSIGKAVGLSEAAVRLRVQRMIDEGIMQIVAVTNPMEMGFARQAMIGITVCGDIEYVAKALAQIRQIDYVVITTGRYDILAEAFSADDEAMLELVNRRIRTIAGIDRTELFSYLRLESQRYDWGVR
ncbi:MAG: Lrp/AsnC family transcriptional regulator [Bifidobacterium tibiigranuli]|jgi:Lrp/AsnC family transcriptional regulator for asnA, asnC and gidA|uniref:Lrp/AsnC family transcriptional regulator n=1 Tax=Bifidobacterium tibiigranuli TaxID=2172043 RepID=UPI0026EDDF3E|nr:Lrp/AsnC family transcriptional regulator [Bifidobacterium tibiigranuli]MCI1674570.1 Lrp/AsnC family transcriptional regulator [Bifidobacterium tibiigranuli]MCI1714142.1 Lrp/AsnC family transcriptional regulator [Bifidobacterium tibiigranuli]